MSVTIRRLSLDKIEQAEQLYQEYMKLNVPREQALRQSIERDDSEILVAETQGRVIGLIHQIFYIDPLHAGACSNILFLYVRELFRRQRVGSMLLEGALNSAARIGVREVHVSTRADNFAAMKLYEKFRFEHAGPLFECTPRKLDERHAA
jgi:ribosomal protein S18 acetylase RimI-like enzyme